jgi:hypothetical protein
MKVIESYAQFLREAAYPHILVPNFHSSGIGKQPYRFEKTMDIKEASDPRWPGAGVPEIEEQGVEIDVAAAHEGVHEVPNLQQEEKDLRDTGA